MSSTLDIAGITGEGKPGGSIGDKTLVHIRPLDALLHCIRFFDSPALGRPEPLKDYVAVEEEMILSDMAVIEKRIERLSKDVQRGRKDLTHELDLLQQAQVLLNDGKPLHTFQPAIESEDLRGFSFLSAKPELILINAGENKSREDIRSILEEVSARVQGQPNVALDWLYADTEAEIARLSEEDAREFLNDLALEEGAKERIIRTSFALLNLIVFFTVGDPEVRAWQLDKGKTAMKAAGVIHSDIERGFIRAEVVGYDDFTEAGSMAAAHKAGKVPA